MSTSTWGVALDGAQARILRDLERNAPDHTPPEEITLDLRPQGPGLSRPPDGTGPGSAAVAEALPAEAAEFCQEVLWLLGSHLRRGDFDGLVVAAPPRVLAELHARRSSALAAATVAETAADLLHLAPQGLRDRLRCILIPFPG